MNPLYFGSADRPLFGVYHRPKGTPRNSGVVLCYPFGQEYMRSHRAFRQLALLLSKRGFHVFRFDYFGTGDSAGRSDEGDVRQWLEDISTVIEELKDTAAIESVSLVGLRLGATLAGYATAERTDIDQLVLWDPLVSGESYVQEIMPPHLPSSGNGSSSDAICGVMGFPVTVKLRESIEVLDLLAPPTAKAQNIFVVSSHESTEFTGLAEHLQVTHSSVTYLCVPSPGNWNEVDNFGGALIPQAIIQAIVAHLMEHCDT